MSQEQHTLLTTIADEAGKAQQAQRGELPPQHAPLLPLVTWNHSRARIPSDLLNCIVSEYFDKRMGFFEDGTVFHH